MSDLRLTRTRLVAGQWEGLLTGPDDATPRLAVTHLGQALDGVELFASCQRSMERPHSLSPSLISDGVHTFVIADADDGTVSGQLHPHCWRCARSDIRVETLPPCAPNSRC